MRYIFTIFNNNFSDYAVNNYTETIKFQFLFTK